MFDQLQTYMGMEMYGVKVWIWALLVLTLVIVILSRLYLWRYHSALASASGPSISDGTGEGVEGYEDDVRQRPLFKALVMYHATWCGHCKTAFPIFLKAKPEIEKLGWTVYDYEEGSNQDMMKAQQIPGYPTIRAYPLGNFLPQSRDYISGVDFGKLPTVEGLVAFVKSLDAGQAQGQYQDQLQAGLTH